MILKASQRGGAKQLGLHLLRTDENEHVELHEIRGFAARDIIGALREAEAVSRGTRCRQFLFSVSLSPPQNERPDQAAFEDALSRIEKKTGLEGHPRVVVFHEKEGRRHAHAAWSRIDANTMTAKNLSHYKLKLRDVSRDLYLEHGWQMPRGLMNSREADPRNFTLEQWQQAKRMGVHGRDLKETVRECWAVSDRRQAFAQALEARGMSLARGDRRGHVAVTHQGEVLSIARYAGKKTKAVRERLGTPDDLPSVDEAKAVFARDMRSAFRRHAAEAQIQKQKALAPLEAKRQTMAEAHRAERARLDAAQKQRWQNETKERSAQLLSGTRGLWQKLTGERRRIEAENTKAAYEGLTRDRTQQQALIDSQLDERQGLQRQISNVRTEHSALLRDLRRDRPSLERAKASPEAERTSPTAKPETRAAHEPEAYEARPQAPERQAAQTLSHAERLQRLRQGKIERSEPERDKPERER